MCPCIIHSVRLLTDCYHSDHGFEYAGKTNVSANGVPCQRWDQQSPYRHTATDITGFPDDTFDDASNYCRNPSKPSLEMEWKPWCFLATGDDRYVHCAIPKCGE